MRVTLFFCDPFVDAFRILSEKCWRIWRRSNGNLKSEIGSCSELSTRMDEGEAFAASMQSLPFDKAGPSDARQVYELPKVSPLGRAAPSDARQVSDLPRYLL